MELFSDPIHQPFEFGEPDGPVGALLIHGFGGTPAEMRYAGEAMADAGVFVRGISLPGFGPDIQNLKNQTDQSWLCATRKEWQLLRHQFDKTILVGFSMGGALATILASEELPDELILMAPFIRFDNRLIDLLLPALQYVKHSVSPFEFNSLDDPDFRKSLLEMLPGLDLNDPDIVAILKKEMVLPTKVLVSLRRLGRLANLKSRQIKTKVTLIQGDADTVVLPDLTEKFKQNFILASDVTLHRLSGGTHAFPKSAGDYQIWLAQSAAAWLPAQTKPKAKSYLARS